MKNRIIPTENRVEMAIVLTMFVVVVLLVIGIMREIRKRLIHTLIETQIKKRRDGIF